MSARRHHSWLVTLPLVAIVIVYIVVVVVPGRRALAVLNNELADKQAAIAGSGHTAVAIAQTQRDLARVDAYCQRWQPSACDSSHVAAIYGRLAELLKESGVSTTRFAPAATEKHDLIEKILVKVAFTGKPNDVARLLESVEKLPERVWIESCEIAPRDGDKNEQIMQGEFVLAIFTGNSGKTD